MTSLVQLRQENEKERFRRQAREQEPEGAGRRVKVDAEKMARVLKERIDGEVRFDRGSRALYATDGSNYRQVPIGVVIPRDVADVIRTVETCREFGAPLLSRGGGTSLAGQCCNVAVLMDFSKYMNRVLEINEGARVARVQPGCVLDELRAAAMKHGLTFGPDPATHSRCTLGGMLGNNSCGSHSHLCSREGMGYRTSDNTHALEILTYDGLRAMVGKTSDEELEKIIRAGGRRGEIYAQLKALVDRYKELIRQRYPKIPRRVSGYNLDELLPENGFHVARALVGTESTCVTILEATLKLVTNPKARTLLLLGYPDVFCAGDHVMDILPFGPTACEGVDKLLFEWEKQRGGHKEGLSLLPKGGGWLYVEFGGESKAEADDAARRCMDALKKVPNAPSMKLYDNPEEEKILWETREGSLGATAWVPGHKDTWEGFEDSAVPPERVGEYLRAFKKLLDKYDYDTSLYGHLAQGCVHCRIPFDFYTKEGVEIYRRFMDEATDLVLSFGGSLSGEHGDGQSRAQFLPKMFGEELVEGFREFKRIWDPAWKMNPGKVVNPYSITDNLRLGPDYDPPEPAVHFTYPTDQRRFSRAVLRCVGIGACRNHGGQTMCPSYMVTREEEHSTRGRARLLWEMMNGDVIEDGWKSEEVKGALDLCLSCKGCKHDCPVNVDMATYKAEFLSHYYEGKIRPRHAYAFGFIHVWARLASVMPAVANWFTHAPGLRFFAKALVGAEQRRRVPAFAGESFKAWWKRHSAGAAERRSDEAAKQRRTGAGVVLFADTFNNYFRPETARAAVEVLEDAGFAVHVPMADMCCGRPLYDYGFVERGRAWLRGIMGKLEAEIERGTPIVVLEPSCCAVFRDELTNLFPDDRRAKKLSEQVFLFSEFLEKYAKDYEVPAYGKKVLMHGHCHHKAVMGMDAEKAVLKKMGAMVEDAEAGCCGMAGAFGYEQGDHYRVSVGAGERALLPAVRNAGEGTVILADGFSCREQIEQGTNRQAMHLAELMHLAKAHGRGGVEGRPERELVEQRQADARRANRRAAATVAAFSIAAVGVWFALRAAARARGNARS